MLPSLRVLCAKYGVLALKDCTQSLLSYRNMRGHEPEHVAERVSCGGTK